MQNNNGQGGKSGLSWSTPQGQGSQQNQQQQQKSPLMPTQQKPVTPGTQPPLMPPSNTNTAKYIGMLVVGVILGVLIAWAFSAMRSSSTTVQDTATTTEQSASVSSATTSTGINGTGTVGTAATNASLVVASPQKPGKSVAISSAIVSQPTWVVVYESQNGQPGRALGARLFFAGSPSGKVDLLRATVSGKSYLVTKQTDNGDRKFSLKNDPLVQEGGKTVWVTLQVQ